MWVAIQAASWASIWAAISAISTTLTVIVAGWAMFRWRKQDELKAKMAFKNAVAAYLYQLAQMPDKIDLSNEQHKKDKATLIDLFAACTFAWLGTEGLLVKNKSVNENWDYISNHHSKYLDGLEDDDKLGGCCYKILSEHFVFK